MQGHARKALLMYWCVFMRIASCKNEDITKETLSDNYKKQLLYEMFLT